MADKKNKKNNKIEEIKIAAFGCWNTGCKENSDQLKVTELLRKNENRRVSGS